MSDSTVKPTDVTFRTEKSGTVADVRNGEAYVDQQIQIAAEKKKTEKLWDGAKVPFRRIAHDVRQIAEEQDQRIVRVNFLGAGDAIVEVELSSTRKALPENAVVIATKAKLDTLVIEEREVVLRGELADWAVQTLGDRTGIDPRFTLKRQRILAPNFEELARQERALKTARVDVFTQLEEAGLRAAAVEAKVRSGS